MMQAGSEQWIALLIQGASQIGVALNPRQADQMAQHAVALTDWNRKINLTAIIDPRQMAIKHFLDSLCPSAHIPSQGALLDIGTGGGFPGLPLKIMRPGQPMTLIDAVRKKINFVKHVIRQLELTNIEAIQTRVEDLSKQPVFQGRFGVIVSRALTDLGALARMALPLLAPEGKIFVYQGPNEEARHLPAALEKDFGCLVKTIAYQLPILGDQRTLVVMERETKVC